MSINNFFYSSIQMESDITDKLSIQKLDIHLFWKKLYLMANDFFQIIPTILLGIVIFLIFYFIGNIIRSIIKRTMKNRRHYNIGLVLARMAQWVLVFLGFLVTLAIIFPSITPADLLTGLGVGGIALGFAFKDILQNYLSGILILLQEPFKIGDEIKHQEFEGKVEFIDTRSTFIKSYDGRRIMIPNGQIYTNAIIVNTTYGVRCTEYDIGIGCSDDLKKAADIIMHVMDSISDIKKDPKPEVFVVALADYSNQLRARWWTTPFQIDVLRIRSKVLINIKQQLFAAGIDIPFPTQVLLWHDQTEATDGQRSKQREGWVPGNKSPEGNSIASSIKDLPNDYKK
jgi:small conductance mechanosensitive channel